MVPVSLTWPDTDKTPPVDSEDLRYPRVTCVKRSNPATAPSTIRGKPTMRWAEGARGEMAEEANAAGQPVDRV